MTNNQYPNSNPQFGGSGQDPYGANSQQPAYGSAPSYGSQDPYANAGQQAQFGDPMAQQSASAFPPGPNEPNPSPTLNEPWYGISIVEATKRYFTKAFRFSGFASRSEFWWAYLVISIGASIIYGVFAGIGAGIIAASESSNGSGAGAAIGIILVIIGWLAMLAACIPFISLTIRRLHDAGFTGWFFLLIFVPFGSLALIIMCILETNKAKWQPGWVDHRA